MVALGETVPDGSSVAVRVGVSGTVSVGVTVSATVADAMGVDGSCSAGEMALREGTPNCPKTKLIVITRFNNSFIPTASFAMIDFTDFLPVYDHTSIGKWNFK